MRKQYVEREKPKEVEFLSIRNKGYTNNTKYIKIGDFFLMKRGIVETDYDHPDTIKIIQTYGPNIPDHWLRKKLAYYDDVCKLIKIKTTKTQITKPTMKAYYNTAYNKKNLLYQGYPNNTIFDYVTSAELTFEIIMSKRPQVIGTQFSRDFHNKNQILNEIKKL